MHYKTIKRMLGGRLQIEATQLEAAFVNIQLFYNFLLSRVVAGSL